MNLFDVNSEEELKESGKLRDLREELSGVLGKQVKIKTNSWDNLFKSIKALKKIAYYVLKSENTDSLASSESVDLYFKSDAEKYIFYLVELDGKLRLDKLAVNVSHYTKKSTADKWRKEIAKVIHPDVCKHAKAEEAMAELNKMYGEMIK